MPLKFYYSSLPFRLFSQAKYALQKFVPYPKIPIFQNLTLEVLLKKLNFERASNKLMFSLSVYFKLSLKLIYDLTKEIEIEKN